MKTRIFAKFAIGIKLIALKCVKSIAHIYDFYEVSEKVKTNVVSLHTKQYTNINGYT